MKLTGKPELLYTFRSLNWACGFIGLLIVGLATHWNGLALTGAFIAGLHFSVRVVEDSQ